MHSRTLWAYRDTSEAFPHLNGKVERVPRRDLAEFYSVISSEIDMLMDSAPLHGEASAELGPTKEAARPGRLLASAWHRAVA